MNYRMYSELCRTCVDYRECRGRGEPRNIQLVYCTNKEGSMMQVRKPTVRSDEIIVVAA